MSLRIYLSHLWRVLFLRLLMGENASIFIPYFKIYFSFKPPLPCSYYVHISILGTMRTWNKSHLSLHLKSLFSYWRYEKCLYLPQICGSWKKSFFPIKVDFKIFSLQPVGIVNISWYLLPMRIPVTNEYHRLVVQKHREWRE